VVAEEIATGKRLIVEEWSYMRLGDQPEDVEPEFVQILEDEAAAGYEDVVVAFDGSDARKMTRHLTVFRAPEGWSFKQISWDDTDKGRNNPETSGYGRGEIVYRLIKDKAPTQEN
jgi:hypothetical protein